VDPGASGIEGMKMKKTEEKKAAQDQQRKAYQPPRVRDEKRLVQDALASF
jgi:hypothetical protein